MTDYITLSDLQGFIKDASGLDEQALSVAITVASRTVDQICNRPYGAFVIASNATAKYFSPESPSACCLVDDGTRWEFGTTTSLTVKLDNDGDGTYETTLTNGTHFYLGPINGTRHGVTGWPYDTLHILATSGTTFPRAVVGYRPPVEVTAKWGWATTPDDIKFATKLIANSYFGRGENRWGVAGIDTGGFVMRIRSDPDIMRLLEPFIPTSKVLA